MAFNYMENISYRNNKPNFERDAVKNLAALLAVDPANKEYDYGHIVFCEEDGEHYKYNYNYNNPPSDGEKDAVTGWFVPLNAETADGSITTDKLATYAVTNEKIANDAIANRHIAPGSIGKQEIMDGHIITSKIEDGAVTAEKLAPAVSEKIESVEAAVVEEKVRAEAAEKAITDILSMNKEIVETLTNVAAWIKDATTEGEAAELIADVEELKPLKSVVNVHEAIIGIKTVTDIAYGGAHPAKLDLSTTPPTVVVDTNTSGYYKSYRINLTPYRSDYNVVYFRGANYGVSSQVVRGYILDDSGVVESYVPTVDSNSNGWQELPITAQSNTLVATYCYSSGGGAVWEPEVVILFNGRGILNEIDTLRTDIIGNATSIEALRIAIEGDNNKEDVAVPADVYPPARYDGSETSGTYKGYKVDLTAYRDNYDFVEFTAANYHSSNDGSSIIRGLILDVDGNIESRTINVEAKSIGLERLPLTERSATLWATYVTDKSVVGDAYKEQAVRPSYVTLIKECRGLSERIEVLERLDLGSAAGDIETLGANVEALTQDVRSVEGVVEALTDEVSALDATLVGSGEVRQRVTIASYGLYPAKIADTSATPLTLVEVSSGYFSGYEIDLTPYRGKYDKIYFRGSNYSKATKNVIARGVILLDDGVTIESYVPTVESNSNGWQELPLTEKSATLRASYCYSSGGGDVWYPYAKTGVTDITDYVEFVREPVSGLSERVEALERLDLGSAAGEIETLGANVEVLGASVKSVESIIEGADESLDVTAIEKTSYPARLDFDTVPPTVVEQTSGYFSGYAVDLTAYRGRYNSVYFRGANYAKSGNLIRGYILDDEGVVESYIENVDSNSNGWQELPLTEKSATLRASYCTNESGGEKWTPEKVTMRFFRLGVSARMDGIEETAVSLTASLDGLSTKVDYLEETGGLQKIEVHLPEDLYVLGDRTTQLFYRGFIRAVNPYIYDIKVMCNVGKTFPRYYEITKNTAAGDYPLRLQVRDDNKNILADKEITLHVVGLPATMSSRNVLCCGASATQTGRWPGELKRMLAAAGVPMNFVGRKYVDAEDVNLEATGGWTWTTFISSGQAAIRFYITSMAGEVGSGTKLLLDGKTYTVLEVNLTEGVGNIRCQPPTNDTVPAVESGTLTTSDGSTTLEFSSWASERFVPFYDTDTGQIDFKTYADKYCDGHIDLIVIHIGVNSTLWETNNVSGVIASAEKFIDGYLADFPDGKLIFSTIPMPDDGSNVYANSYGVSNINRYGTLTTFMLYNTSMYELTQRDEYKGKVLFAPSSIFFDTDYGYPKTKKNVNTRISEYTELIGTNGMHPVVEGSYMIADGILPIFTLLE